MKEPTLKELIAQINEYGMPNPQFLVNQMKKAQQEIESLRLENYNLKCNGAALREQITQLIEKGDEWKRLAETSVARLTIERDEWKRRARVYYDHSTAWTGSLPEEAFDWFKEEE